MINLTLHLFPFNITVKCNADQHFPQHKFRYRTVLTCRLLDWLLPWVLLLTLTGICDTFSLGPTQETGRGVLLLILLRKGLDRFSWLLLLCLVNTDSCNLVKLICTFLYNQDENGYFAGAELTYNYTIGKWNHAWRTC